MGKAITFWKVTLYFLLIGSLTLFTIHYLPFIEKNNKWEKYFREIAGNSLNSNGLAGILVVNPNSWEVTKNLETKDSKGKAVASLVSFGDFKGLPTIFNNKNRISIYLLNDTHSIVSEDSFFQELLKNSTSEQKKILNLAYSYTINNEKPYLNITLGNIQQTPKEVFEKIYDTLYKITKNNQSIQTLILLD